MGSSPPLLPSLPDEAAFYRLRGDPAPWLPALTEICRLHGLPDEDLYAERTGTNVVFRAGDGPWIKLFPPLWPEDFERERAGLAAVRGVAGLAAPQLLHEGELEGWPYAVISHLEGRPISSVWLDLPAAEQVGLAEEIGAAMARLHEIPAPSSGVLAEDWPAFVARRGPRCVERNRKYDLPTDWLEPLRRFTESAQPLLRPGAPGVLLHADLTDQHIFVRRVRGRWSVTGLIDFGDAMVGDPLYEFAAPAMFLTQGKPEAQRALLRGYGIEDAPDTLTHRRRIQAWTLLHRFSLVRNALRFAPEPKPRDLRALVDLLWHIDA